LDGVLRSLPSMNKNKSPGSGKPGLGCDASA
jgi:hypothetical protein